MSPDPATSFGSPAGTGRAPSNWNAENGEITLTSPDTGTTKVTQVRGDHWDGGGSKEALLDCLTYVHRVREGFKRQECQDDSVSAGDATIGAASRRRHDTAGLPEHRCSAVESLRDAAVLLTLAPPWGHQIDGEDVQGVSPSGTRGIFVFRRQFHPRSCSRMDRALPIGPPRRFCAAVGPTSAIFPRVRWEAGIRGAAWGTFPKACASIREICSACCGFERLHHRPRLIAKQRSNIAALSCACNLACHCGCSKIRCSRADGRCRRFLWLLRQTVGGAVGAANHGSSFAHGTMSDSIASLVLVAPNGQDIVELTNDGNSRALLQAARVGLGRLGVLVGKSDSRCRVHTKSGERKSDLRWDRPRRSGCEGRGRWWRSRRQWSTAGYTGL